MQHAERASALTETSDAETTVKELAKALGVHDPPADHDVLAHRIYFYLTRDDIRV